MIVEEKVQLRLDENCSTQKQPLEIEEQVKQQYEQFPYPSRCIEAEYSRLVPTFDSVPMICHYCFGGEPFSSNARILVAGGGTGDSTLYLAEQLRHEKGSHIYHVDVSEKSNYVAQMRAKARNLQNITWVKKDFLELSVSEVGVFDYINCSGVVHHLKSPLQGMKKLKSLLKEKGGMGIMVYGKARFPVYQIKELVCRLTKHEPDIEKKLHLVRCLLSQLPPFHLFSLQWKQQGLWKTDIEQFGDAGLVDLFLHAQETSFDTAELETLVEQSGLTLLHLIGEMDPLQCIQNERLERIVKRLSFKEKRELSELLAGNGIRHCGFVGPASVSPPVWGEGGIPCFAYTTGENVANEMKKLYSKGITEWKINQRQSLCLDEESICCIQKINGRLTAREIVKEVGSMSKKNEEVIMSQLQQIYEIFHSTGQLFLLKTQGNKQ